MTQSKIISFIVENKPGVLFKVTNMIRRRCFNIDSITVGTVDHKEISKMTLTIDGDESTVEQVVKQLLKLIDVLDVNVWSPNEAMSRELALVKLSNNAKKLLNKVSDSIYRIIDTSADAFTLEVVGTPEEIDSLLERFPYSEVQEIARTGMTAVRKC